MLGGYRVTRSPRYILGESDRRHLKFVSSRTRARKVVTQVYDISATGISFFSSKKWAPEAGETVSVEFFIPGFTQVACHGRVARVEEILDPERGDSLWAQKIGVEFLNIPTPMRDALDVHIGQALRGRPGAAATARLRYRPSEPIAPSTRTGRSKTGAPMTAEETRNAAWLVFVLVALVVAGKFISDYQQARKPSSAPSNFGENFARAVSKK